MIINLRNFLKGNVRRLKKDERGATAIEYGLIAALISVAIIAGASALGSSLSTTFNTLSNTMSTASTKAGNYAK